MKAELSLPVYFTEYLDGPIISNLNSQIDEEIEKKIKGTANFSRYSAWNFNGLVWWADDIGYWCIEVWRFNKYVANYLADSLEELAKEVDDLYGDGETASFL